VRFDIVWRTAGGVETVVASTTHTFAAGRGVQFDTDLAGIAAPATPGDKLILRFTTVGGGALASYTPNGDGALVGARVPSLTLPPP
jgi:hypothetical protein